MPFNYNEMKKMADTLLSSKEFGGPFILQRTSGKMFDPVKMKEINITETFEGNCVQKIYEDDGLGKLSDIVEAGDVVFVCTMKDQSITPAKNSDKIIFGGITYNVIEVSTVKPNGNVTIVHKCYARKASK